VVGATLSATGGGSAVDRLVAEVVGTVRALRDNELFVRIVELDPELLLPYLLSRRGRSQEALIEILAAEIESGQRSGAIRAGDPVVMARSLTLAGHGFVFSAMTMTDAGVSLEALDEEYARLITASLAPS
jgi:hypothetical protein